MEKRQNLILGLLFTGLGLAATWMARSYSGAGGTYPQVLGLLMAFLGLVIAGRAVKQANSSEPNRLIDAPVKLFLAIAACVLYVAMVVPLGFYTASILLMILLPLLLGFRRPMYLAMMAFGFMTILWLMFSVILEKPLPAEIWQSISTSSN